MGLGQRAVGALPRFVEKVQRRSLDEIQGQTRTPLPDCIRATHSPRIVITRGAVAWMESRDKPGPRRGQPFSFAR